MAVASPFVLRCLFLVAAVGTVHGQTCNNYTNCDDCYSSRLNPLAPNCSWFYDRFYDRTVGDKNYTGRCSLSPLRHEVLVAEADCPCIGRSFDCQNCTDGPGDCVLCGYSGLCLANSSRSKCDTRAAVLTNSSQCPGDAPYNLSFCERYPQDMSCDTIEPHPYLSDIIIFISIVCCLPLCICVAVVAGINRYVDAKDAPGPAMWCFIFPVCNKRGRKKETTVVVAEDRGAAQVVEIACDPNSAPPCEP